MIYGLSSPEQIATEAINASHKIEQMDTTPRPIYSEHIDIAGQAIQYFRRRHFAFYFLAAILKHSHRRR